MDPVIEPAWKLAQHIESSRPNSDAVSGDNMKMRLNVETQGTVGQDAFDGRIGRRQMLVGLSAAGLHFSGAHLLQATGIATLSVPPGKTPDEALAALQAGNQRFVAGNARHAGSGAGRRAEIAKGQSPFAAILGCSDSRVPPELVFDQGLGDLFVMRVAGNVVDVAALGSIEYGVLHLNTPLIMVLGHESCGAVMAALSPHDGAHDSEEPEALHQLIGKIRPSLGGIDAHLSQADQVKAGVEANVHQSMKVLSETPELAKAVAAKTLRIVGAVYDLASGKVLLLA
jgi:carbonic anhydrase